MPLHVAWSGLFWSKCELQKQLSERSKILFNKWEASFSGLLLKKVKNCVFSGVTFWLRLLGPLKDVMLLMVLSWAIWNCSSNHTRWCSLDIFFLTMWGFSWRAWPFFPVWGRGWGLAVGIPLYGTAPRLQLGRYQSRNAPANTHKNDFRLKVAFPVFFVL